MNSNQFIWSDRFKIGVDIIDREHRKLFSIMNKLLAYNEEDEKQKWAYQEGIKYFKEHAMKHFAEEEVYMASIGYLGYETHRRIHDNFRKITLPEVERELQQSDYSPDAIRHFLGVCAGWLIGHTLTEDRAIAGKASSKWEGILPEDQQASMKKIIIQLLQDMFHLNARVISENYGGEEFGKGIYYRLVCGTKNNERSEIYLVFEEKLLTTTLSEVMGIQSNKLDALMMNVMRYTAQQFVKRIQMQFPSAEMSEVKEENLLTYTLFEKAFDRNSPQCSLLFDTGEGYFAYCVMAPHLLKETVGPVIREENAMSEIKKYLEEQVDNNKKRILVVDDSIVMQKAMKDLLDKDYQVVLANSGAAAIRSMTLDQPDLVLLDYEMPVCDGRQVLEMIRAEEGLADTPVVFLTSRVDKESIQNVKSLKPAGYLPKSMDPAKIKENIDSFFRKKSILIVDDSIVMQKAMKDLLEKDYRIALANSGAAAIRSMTLDRPDLVLLDYEMPVCDGRQVLEMIRAEKELADTPVIFLTSRYDKESVQNVLALKPAGYLPKSMAQEEIKKNIDGFFKNNR